MGCVYLLYGMRCGVCGMCYGLGVWHGVYMYVECSVAVECGMVCVELMWCGDVYTWSVAWCMECVECGMVYVVCGMDIVISLHV